MMRSLHAHRAHVGIVCVTLAALHGVAGLIALADNNDPASVFNGKMIALLLLAALAWNPPQSRGAEGSKS